MKRLKHTLLFKNLRGNYKIILFLSVLFLLIYKTTSHYLILIFIVYFLYLLKIAPKIALYSILMIVYIIIRIFINNVIINNYTKDNYQYSGYLKVEKVKKVENNYQVILKDNYVKYLTYFDEETLPGDIYYITGTLNTPDTAHFEGGFNYQEYLNNQNIVGIMNVKEKTFYKKSFSKYQLNYKINKYFDKTLRTTSKGMIKALTIGNKDDFEENLFNSITEIGISHLFVISGLHVNLIIAAIAFILKKMKLKEKKQNILTTILLIIYYVICGFMISIFRVICSFILGKINKHYQYGLTSIDIISINIIIVILFNYKIVFSYGFILTYIISFGIIITSKLLSKRSGFIYHILDSTKISVLSILITLPIIININHDLNFLSIIYNLFYIPFVSYIMLPLSIIVIIIPSFEIIYSYIYQVFNLVTNFLSNINIMTLTFPKVNLIVIIMYYVILYMIYLNLETKKSIKYYVTFFILLLMFWNNQNIFNIYDEVYFLDLPKGEATLIRESNNKCNILIDTGENGYDDIINFLKIKGIKRLDAIIISHGDSDHNGMLDEITDEFKVKIVYYSIYDKITPQLISKKINKIPLKKGDIIKYSNIIFEVISPTNNYNDTNNNSLVLYSKIFNKTYLFTGDIESKVEKKLPNIGNIDFLKIPHHGSNTSTSNELLNKINYKMAICMNGYRNQFSFPSQKIIEKLEPFVLITSDVKTIVIRKNKINGKYILKYKI